MHDPKAKTSNLNWTKFSTLFHACACSYSIIVNGLQYVKGLCSFIKILIYNLIL